MRPESLSFIYENRDLIIPAFETYQESIFHFTEHVKNLEESVRWECGDTAFSESQKLLGEIYEVSPIETEIIIETPTPGITEEEFSHRNWTVTQRQLEIPGIGEIFIEKTKYTCGSQEYNGGFETFEPTVDIPEGLQPILRFLPEEHDWHVSSTLAWLLNGIDTINNIHIKLYPSVQS